MKSLYLHIPFCEKKCFYCSFVVAVGQEHRMEQYLNALAKEAAFYKGTKVDSIYIGGGTPTFLSQELLTKLFSVIRHNFQFDPQSELTIEANPEGLDIGKAKLLGECGVNRISLGVQSLNNKYLKYLGRNHDRARARLTFETIRTAGFNNVSVDLMYGFENQTLDELEKDVKELARWESEHTSLYTLTIEENTRFHTQKASPPAGVKAAEQYEFVVKILADHGFSQYEISNFAKQDKKSKHNLNYWQGGDYIGLGVGAHSHSEGRRSWNVSQLTDYLKKIENGQSPIESSEELSIEKRFMETFLFGLRMNEGVDLPAMEDRFKLRLDSDHRELLTQFINEGFLLKNKGVLQTTLKGRVVLDELCARLI